MNNTKNAGTELSSSILCMGFTASWASFSLAMRRISTFKSVPYFNITLYIYFLFLFFKTEKMNRMIGVYSHQSCFWTSILWHRKRPLLMRQQCHRNQHRNDQGQCLGLSEPCETRLHGIYHRHRPYLQCSGENHHL